MFSFWVYCFSLPGKSQSTCKVHSSPTGNLELAPPTIWSHGIEMALFIRWLRIRRGGLYFGMLVCIFHSFIHILQLCYCSTCYCFFFNLFGRCSLGWVTYILLIYIYTPNIDLIMASSVLLGGVIWMVKFVLCVTLPSLAFEAAMSN